MNTEIPMQHGNIQGDSTECFDKIPWLVLSDPLGVSFLVANCQIWQLAEWQKMAKKIFGNFQIIKKIGFRFFKVA